MQYSYLRDRIPDIFMKNSLDLSLLAGDITSIEEGVTGMSCVVYGGNMLMGIRVIGCPATNPTDELSCRYSIIVVTRLRQCRY